MPKKGSKKGVSPVGSNIPVHPIEGETIDIVKGRKKTPSPIPLSPKTKK